ALVATFGGGPRGLARIETPFILERAKPPRGGDAKRQVWGSQGLRRLLRRKGGFVAKCPSILRLRHQEGCTNLHRSGAECKFSTLRAALASPPHRVRQTDKRQNAPRTRPTSDLALRGRLTAARLFVRLDPSSNAGKPRRGRAGVVARPLSPREGGRK